MWSYDTCNEFWTWSRLNSTNALIFSEESLMRFPSSCPSSPNLSVTDGLGAEDLAAVRKSHALACVLVGPPGLEPGSAGYEPADHHLEHLENQAFPAQPSPRRD